MRQAASRPRRDARLLVAGLLFLAAQASCDGCGDDPTTPALAGITVTPTNAAVAVGASVNFTATLRYRGDPPTTPSAVEWSVSDPAVAGIDLLGTATGRAPGTVMVTARSGGASGTATLVVRAAPARTLTAISVQPAAASVQVGKTLALAATGSFSDGTQEDVTARTAWSSASPQVAAVAGGTVTGLSAGTALVTAAIDGRAAMATITVTEPALVALAITPADLVLAEGETHPCTATASYADASTRDVTATVIWTSSRPEVATVSNQPGAAGQVTAVARGTTSIGASFQGQVASVALAVQPAVLELALEPSEASLAPGSALRLSARGLLSDGAVRDVGGQVRWDSSNPGVLAVDAGGRVRALAAGGSATITARAGAVVRSSAVTISPSPLTSLAFQTGRITLAPDSGRALGLVGVFADGRTQDLTDSAAWSSSDPAVASVSTADGSRGRIRAVAPGSASVDASFGGRIARAAVLVPATTLVSVSVIAGSNQLAPGTTTVLRAVAAYSDGRDQDVTGQVTWASSSATVAAPSVDGDAAALEASNPGRAMVSARLGTRMDTVAITVTDAQLQGLQVTPGSVRLARDTASRLRTSGTFSDGSTQDLTADVFWTTPASALASVSNARGRIGRLKGRQSGTTDVAVRLRGISGSAQVEITQASVTAIEVSPQVPAIARGLERPFAATGTFSDGSMQALDSEAVWTTSDDSRLVVSNVPGSAGLATAVAEGTAMITASFGGRSGTTAVTVGASAVVRLLVTPVQSSIPRGGSVDLRAAAEYSDGSTPDVTAQARWESGAPGVASVSSEPGSVGRVTGNLLGSVTITVDLGGVLGFATVEVTP